VERGGGRERLERMVRMVREMSVVFAMGFFVLDVGGVSYP